MTTPLPQPDAQYTRDIDAAYHRRGRSILRAIAGTLAADPDMHRARLAFNAMAAPVDPQFAADVEAAQAALRHRHRPVGTCAGCGDPMDVIEPGQEYHPNCGPTAPDGAAALDAYQAASNEIHYAEEEDW